jgi:hypothetical protein
LIPKAPSERFLPLAAKFENACGWKVLGLAVSPSVTCPGAFERVGYISFHSDVNAGTNVLEEIFTFFEPNRRENVILV